MGGKDLVPPSSQIYGGSGSSIITDGGVHVKTHKNLMMGPSFFKPFFALAGTFFLGLSAEIRTKKINAGAGCKFS